MDHQFQAKDISDLLILQLIQIHSESGGDFAYKILIDLGFPEKVVYAKYDKLDRRGFMECGVSLRTGWLTEAGKKYLEELKTNVRMGQ